MIALFMKPDGFSQTFQQQQAPPCITPHFWRGDTGSHTGMIPEIKPLTTVLANNTKPAAIRFQGMMQRKPDVVTLYVGQPPVALGIVTAKPLGRVLPV